MGTMVVWVDAGTQIGTGHLMRCLALAQAWKDKGGEVIFLTACQNEGLLQRLREEEFGLHVLSHPVPEDWNDTRKILSNYSDAWVVLDGYHFDETYQRRVKEAGHRLLVIDDMAHLKHYYADIVLNQNLHAEQLRYSCEPYTRLLMGTRYVLLRREFLTWRGWERKIPEVARQVLVTLGGADLENHTLKVIQALQQVNTSGLETIVVVGASNPHADVLEAAIRESHIPLRLIYDANNMPELMAWADVAVASAGTTVWELAFMGCATISYVRNPVQEAIIRELDRLQVLKYQGYLDRMEPDSLLSAIHEFSRDRDRRHAVCQLGRKIVSGKGTERILSAIADLY
jgi:UDP-2,4-diacetamido-2,4,6-trideoxy-beta-L-altropyranose hydrolase